MSLETLNLFRKNAMVRVLRDIGADREITPHPPALYFFCPDARHCIQGRLHGTIVENSGA